MKRIPGLAGMLFTCSLAVAAEPWTLERALDYALTHNPDARLAQQRIVAAQAGLQQADAAFWPQVQAQSSYTRTDNPMTVFGDILSQRAFAASGVSDYDHLPTVDDANVEGIVTVPLYAGGRHVAQRAAAQANAWAAQQDSAAVRNALGFEVTRAFYTVRKTRQFVRAAAAEVKAFENDLATAQKRLAAGTLLKSDELDFEVRLARAREDLISARNAETLAVRALRNLLGIDHGEFAVADTLPVIRAPKSTDFSERPELAAARQREQAAAAQVRAARSGYLPSLNAFGSAGYDYGTQFDHGGRNYTVGVMAQWNLWDGNLTRAKVRQARANWESAREEERKLSLAIDLEVEQARLDLQTAEQRLAVTDKAVEQARQSAQLTRDRFEQGLALSTQLIDSETALVVARVRRAEAEADRGIAIAALRKALGLPQLDTDE
ncbi:MAG TPA: TolC family protein [Verrucomicrobiae bacterium]|nr:TolC family protein [Verrucomicrobiae bacterium]